LLSCPLRVKACPGCLFHRGGGRTEVPNQSASKRILIVDDEERVAYSLRASLEQPFQGYQVDTADSGPEALRLLSSQPFDLVVTDLKMTGMDGLELMAEVRRAYPHTRLILMTAYGSDSVEEAAYRLGACRYINKPFSIEEFRAAVSLALTEPRAPGRGIVAIDDDTFDDIVRCLADTRFEVGAQCILLANVVGQMVAHVGVIADLDVAPLISLIGGSFATTFEMRRLLGEAQLLTLNYHEGERYDVYSSNVNEDLFLVLLFDRRHERSRVGNVWLYTKRALGRLRGLLSRTSATLTRDLLDADFGSQLNDSLDQLWIGEEPLEAPASQPVIQAQEKPRPGRVDRLAGGQSQQAKTSCPPAGTFGTSDAPANGLWDDDSQEGAPETYTLQQALEMGLLGQAWLEGGSTESEGV